MGMTIRTFCSVDPAGVRLTLLHGLISPGECDVLIRLGKEREQRALVADDTTGEDVLGDNRTGSMAWVDQDHPVVQAVNRRIEILTGLPLAHQEPLQVLHYLPGQEYRANFDAFPENNGQLRYGGNRVATILLYLNDVAGGGATFFPELDMTVLPHRGFGVFFRSTLDGHLLTKSLHAGTPVLRGEKWIATKWVREGNYQR